MKKLSLAAVLIALLAAPASAGIRGCNNNLVSAGVCRNTSNEILSFDFTTTDMNHLAKRAARLGGWTSTVPCTAALVSDGICTQGELDAGNVTKPYACTSALVASKLCKVVGTAMSKKDFAAAWIRRDLLNDWLRSESAKDIDDTKKGEADAAKALIVDPDIGD